MRDPRGAERDSLPPRTRRRDFWQLDVPLAVVLIVCTVLTIVELRRANEGIWRAWVYTFEWPVIAGVCIWMWRRFRADGTSMRPIAQRWRDRVTQYEAEAEAAEEAARQAAPQDADLARWQDYQRRLRAEERARDPG